MDSYKQDILSVCPTGLVSQKVSEIELGSPAPKDIQSKTVQIAAKQTSKGPLRRQNKAAEALEESHTTGQTSVNVQKMAKRRTPKHKALPLLSKELRAKEIRERRVLAEKSKAPLAAMYEGFGLDFKVEEATTENFRKVFTTLLAELKNTINNNKNIIEHVIKLDGASFSKLVFALSAVVASVGFAAWFTSAGPFVKFLVGGLGAVAGMWAYKQEIKDFVIKRLLKYFSGFDYEQAHLDALVDIATVEEDFLEFMGRDHTSGNTESTASSSARSMLDVAIDWFSMHYEGVFDHGFGPLSFVLSEVAAGAASIITGFVICTKGKSFVKSVVDNKRVSSDFSAILTDLLKWIASQVDKVFKTDFSTYFARTKELDSWGEDVSNLYAIFADGKLEMTATSAKRVNSLNLRGIDIAKNHATMDASSWAYHRFCMGMVSKMDGVLGAAGVPISERQVPLTLCLRGESGIGKSYITHALIDEIAMRALKGEARTEYMKNHLNEKYMWLSEEEHANGYNGQFCTIFDDFGQFLTQKGQADDYQRIIRMANAAPCRLNAAELERKGRLVFTSSLMICSTNLYKFYSPSLAKPEALIRRFDVWVDMVPRVEFCTDATKDLGAKERRLDTDKLKAAIEYDACEYRILKCLNPDQQVWQYERTCTFKELVDLCLVKYEKHQNNHSRLMEALKARREEINAEYEGFFDWMKKKCSFSEKVASTYASLRDTMKLKIMDIYMKAKTAEFQRTAAIILAIIGVVVVASCLLIGAFKFVKNRKKTSFEGPLYEAELLEGNGSNMRLFHNKLMKSILDRNVYHMYRPYDDPAEEDSVGCITMVTGTKGIMNYHYIAQLRTILEKNMPDFKHVKVVSHSNPENVHMVPISCFLDPDNVAIDESSDLILIKFDKSFPVCRDIVKHFVTEDAVEQNRDFNTSLYIPRAPRSLEVLDITKRKITQPVIINGNIHDDLVLYKADTQTGDCGSLVAYSGDYANTTERIVGIHMAGLDISGKKHGYATVVTQKKLRSLIDMLEWQPRIEAPIEVEGKFLKNLDTCHTTVARIEKPLFQPRKTAIIPSVLQGHVGPVTKVPARLGIFSVNGEKFDPVVLAHQRQHSFNAPIDSSLVSLVVADVVRVLRPHIKNTSLKLDFRQAVKGHDALPCMGPIPRQTSAGFSYKDDPRAKKGKKDFFGYDGEYEFDSELCKDLEGRVEALLEQMRDGVVPEDRVYSDVLKDENVAISKWEVGKTRMISACDLPMSVIYRSYYGAVCNDLVASRLVNGIAVGTNPYGKEWDVLARFLSSKNKKGGVIAGDFSGYDNSQSCQLIQATMEVLNELTGLTSESDKRVLEVLAVTLSQPYHASGGYIYELDHGMPSGNPMTTIMNSIFGLIAFRLCWLSCTFGDYVSPSTALRAFEKEVYLVMYGDDNLLNVSARALPKFNQNTMMAHFPKFGLKYTSDKKEDTNPPPSRDISEVTFLKRTFRKCDVMGRTIAPLDKDTIKNMLNWTKKGGSANSITFDNCENAIREWSLHGKQLYEEESHQLQSVVKNVMGLHLEVPSHECAVHEACGQVPSWIREHI